MSVENVLERFPWINNDFVQEIIENCERNKNVTLKSFEAKSAFESGENFSSHMVALTVVFNDGIEREKDFLMKIAIQTEDYAKVCKECHIYEREIEAYTQILPVLEEKFESIGISGRIAPRCFMADIEKRMLVFEDLREQQFKCEDKMHGLDLEHLKLTLKTLAKWHAGTATLLLTNPELFENYKKFVDYRESPILNGFFNNIAKSVSNAIKNWPGFENIAEKLENIPQSTHNSMYEMYQPRENGFNVITHGDMFMNNILFRKDENENLIDIRFVDFPLGKHTCPSIDLVWLLYGSADSAISQSDREHLIGFYHSALTSYLKSLQCVDCAIHCGIKISS